MGRYLLERAGIGILIVVLAVTLLFGMIHLVPGDPVSIMLGPRASPELRQALLERMRLDLDGEFATRRAWALPLLSPLCSTRTTIASDRAAAPGALSLNDRVAVLRGAQLSGHRRAGRQIGGGVAQTNQEGSGEAVEVTSASRRRHRDPSGLIIGVLFCTYVSTCAQF